MTDKRLLALLKSDPRIERNGVFLLGHSMGAMLAPRIDAEGADVRGLILLAGIMMLMEFVLDQKIGFLLWIRADLSYLIDAACCAGMIALVIPLWRKAFPEEAGEKGRCGDAGQRADKGRG